MHPTHIPLKAEIQASILCLIRYFWPCGRFFCNHNDSRISLLYDRIQMFKEFDCFKIFISTINIRNPLTIFSSIVKIKHRGNCIYTKSVYMILFQPKQGITNEEVPDFCLPIIKYFRSPVWMFTLSWVSIFIKTGSIKFS